MKKLITFILIIWTLQSYSQNVLLLDSCIEISVKNHPLSENKSFTKNISDLNVKNIRTNYLPGLSVEGKASYQSQTLSLDIDFPTFPGFDITLPEPPLDQYNMSLNLNQIIWDGGITKHLTYLEKVKLKAEQKKTDIDLFNLKEQVENTYFNVLAMQESEEQIILTLDELKQKKKSVKSAVDNGVLTYDNYDILLAEILKLEQSLIEIQENKQAGLIILEEFMNEDLNDDIILVLPEDFEIKSDSLKIHRPENEFFNIQSELLSKQSGLLTSKRMPSIGAFAQAGYGNPGLTMINDEWNSYYIIGAKLSWNIWDKNKTKREKEILKIKEDIISNNIESFNKNIKIQSEKQLADINKLQKIIRKDEEIIALQESICNKAESKLLNGIITSTEYIGLVNEKSRSKIKKDVHTIHLIQAKRNYLRTIGN